MELQQLVYFSELAKNDSVTAAAKKLHITQSTLSRSIGKLEDELGTQLFARTKGKLYLNEAGSIFLSHAERALSEVHVGTAKVKDFINEEKKDVIICCKPIFVTKNIMVDFVLKYPEIRLKQSDILHYDLNRKLENQEIDFAICFNTSIVQTADIIWEELYSDYFYAVVSRDNPLSERSEISFSELKGQRFLINNALDELTDIIYDMCAERGFDPDVVYNGSQQEVLEKLTSRNFGICIMGESVKRIREIQNDRLLSEVCFIKIHDSSCTRTIGIARNKKRKLTKNAETARKFFSDNIKMLNALI